MKDIPMFTTEYGIASMVLREIPYQKCAYITMLTSSDAEKLLAECVSFCRMCGAEQIFAKGDPSLEQYPLYTVIWEMQGEKAGLPETDAMLWPVQTETVEYWRQIYNRKCTRIPNAAWMTEKDAKGMLEDASGYFVHRDGTLLGIGKIWENEIQWVASVHPGAGADVLAALSSLSQDQTLKLTVAAENRKAVKLYRKLGFLPVRELSRWYKIIKKGVQ